MASTGGANTAVDGLVFGYDTGYPLVSGNLDTYKFNRGEPTTNLISNPQLTTITNTTVGDASITKQDFGDGRVGLRFIQFATGNIVSFSPSLTSFSPVSGGTYTFSADVRSTKTDKTLKNQLWVYVNGVRHWLTDSLTWSTSTTENGVLLRSPTSINTWERYSVSFTLPTGTLTSFGISGFYRRTSNFVTDVANFQFELNSTLTPFTIGTRSSTQSLIDLTRTTNIDVSNVSFDSNAQMTFDGTDDYISLDPNARPTGGVGSIEAIIKPTSNNAGGIVGWGDGGTSNWGGFDTGNRTSGFSDEVLAFINLSSGAEDLVFYGRDSGGTNQLNDGKYHHVVVVVDGVENTMYLDGVKMSTISFTYGNATSTHFMKMTTLNKLRVGNSTYNNGHIPFTGEIPVVKIYDRGLTAQEVQQNYNAVKERFNL